MRWKICVRTFLSEPIKRGLFLFHAIRIHMEPLQKESWILHEALTTFVLTISIFLSNMNLILETSKTFPTYFYITGCKFLKGHAIKVQLIQNSNEKNLRHNKIKCTSVSSLWHFNIPWGKFWTKFYYLIFFVSDPGRGQLVVRS